MATGIDRRALMEIALEESGGGIGSPRPRERERARERENELMEER